MLIYFVCTFLLEREDTNACCDIWMRVLLSSCSIANFSLSLKWLRHNDIVCFLKFEPTLKNTVLLHNSSAAPQEDLL